MHNFLNINIEENNTVVKYIFEGQNLFEYKYNKGLDFFVKSDWSLSSGKSWMSYILWSLHSISYMDRIPTKFIVNVSQNGYFFITLLENYKYVEFFTFDKGIHVILNSEYDLNNQKHARYKKAVSQFKI